MNKIPCSISFHPSSLFRPPLPSALPPQAAAEEIPRSCSRDSISSIETEFTHFKPVRRHPITSGSGRQMVRVKPVPVRATISTDCTLSMLGIDTDKLKDQARIATTRSTESMLGIETDQDRDQARIKQEKMDCELAWRIHRQEKRFIFRQSLAEDAERNLNNQTRYKKKKGGVREDKVHMEDKICQMEVGRSKPDCTKRQLSRQRSIRKCQFS
jgi:hypothetical protein